MNGAGDYKEYISVYRASITINQVGEEEENWEKITETRAKVEKTRGNRDLIDNEVFYTAEKNFTLRHYVDVKEFDRIEHQGKYYKITNIDYFPEKMEKIVSTTLIND